MEGVSGNVDNIGEVAWIYSVRFLFGADKGERGSGNYADIING